MLSSGEDIHKSFLYGIRKSATSVVTPEKFVRIWNEWALRDWKETNHFHDIGPEVNKIIRDKLQNLVRWYYYLPDDDNKWLFSIPDGSTVRGYKRDPYGTANVPPRGEYMPKFVRHLSAQFKLDYDKAESQECGLTGVSDWLDANEVYNDDLAVYSRSYYLKPSDHNLYYKIENDKIHLFNGAESEPKWILLEYLKDLNQMTESNDVITYTIDLTQEQLQEVVESAVRIHLENLKSERYQTFLNEDKIRQK